MIQIKRMLNLSKEIVMYCAALCILALGVIVIGSVLIFKTIFGEEYE